MPLSQFAPDQYDTLFTEKCNTLRDRFSHVTTLAPTCFASAAEGFRMRCEFRMWHEGDALDYVMFDPKDKKTPVVIESFPIAHQCIQVMMPKLRRLLSENAILRRKLFQVEFLASQNGALLITLIYHRALDEAWQAQAKKTAEDLGVHLIGRSRKQRIVLTQSHVNETLRVSGREYHYEQPEQAFTQPNAGVNENMIGWAQTQADQFGGDLLELYCGIGNFTFPLARCFDRVLATEVSKVATNAAHNNRELNQADNVEFARLSAEEMSQALAGAREFRRLSSLHQPLKSLSLNTLLVDPPRAGLDPQTCTLAQQFERIIYISCNPTTLLRDLEQLTQSHRCSSWAIFDQFPYTSHVECGVMLQRKAKHD